MIVWQERNCPIIIYSFAETGIIKVCCSADQHYHWRTQKTYNSFFTYYSVPTSFVVLVSQYGVTYIVWWRPGWQASSSWSLPAVFLLQPQSQQANLHLYEWWHSNTYTWEAKGTVVTVRYTWLTSPSIAPEDLFLLNETWMSVLY